MELDGPAVHLGGAGGGAVRAGHHLEQRGFPAPLSPMSATTSPFITWKSIWSKARSMTTTTGDSAGQTARQNPQPGFRTVQGHPDEA
jgi:hypothetical protein